MSLRITSNLKIKKGLNEVNVSVVKATGSVERVPLTLFNVTTPTDPYSFSLTLQKSDGTLFNIITDKTNTIQLTVKEGTKEVYKINNLFGRDDIKDKNFSQFKITLPKKKDDYSNSLTIAGTVTHGGGWKITQFYS